MASAARENIAEPKRQHRRDLVGDDDRSRAMHRVIYAVDEVLVIQLERLARTDRGDGRYGVFEIEKTGADVKSVMPGKPVHMELAGAKVQFGVVMHTVDAERITIGEKVRAGAQIEAARERRGDFDARAQRIRFNADGEAGERAR